MFACPFCAAQYPLKPVLIGKTVRCTTCKNPFRLRADGIADKAEAPAVPSPTTPQPVPQAHSQPEAPSAPANRPLSQPTPKAGMTRQQQEARKAMSDHLALAMGDVLGLDDEAPAEPAKPGTERRTASERTKTASLNKPKSSVLGKAGIKGKKSPAILTGEGEREAANSRRWQFGFVGLVVFVGLVAWLLMRHSDTNAAVVAFTTELPRQELTYGTRLPAIQARAWVGNVTTFIDLPNPRVGQVHELAAATISEPLARLKGLVFVPTAERWTTPDVAAWLSKQPDSALAAINRKFEHDGTVQVSVKALRQALSAANAGDDEVTIIWTLLTQPPAVIPNAGQPSRSGPSLADLVTAGNVPTIRWCAVSGRGGTILSDNGQRYTTEIAGFQGLLVSFAGEGWPTGWRFMTLSSTK